LITHIQDAGVESCEAYGGLVAGCVKEGLTEMYRNKFGLDGRAWLFAALLCVPSVVTGQAIKEHAQGKLVAGFPSIPIYPGAVVEESSRVVEGNKVGFEAELITDDPVFDVYSFYLDALKRNGWEISFASENSPSAEEQGLGAIKDDLRIYIEFEKDDGSTEIDIEIPLQEAALDK
jgi:hypothetical protein